MRAQSASTVCAVSVIHFTHLLHLRHDRKPLLTVCGAFVKIGIYGNRIVIFAVALVVLVIPVAYFKNLTAYVYNAVEITFTGFITYGNVVIYDYDGATTITVANGAFVEA